jgi:hypothetical protein
MTAEQKAKVRELAARHNQHPQKGVGINVQVTCQVHSAVLFFGLSEADLMGLTDEEFNQLCFETAQDPYTQVCEGTLDMKHDAEFVNRRDYDEEEY